jgi:hypothetical protein
VVFCFGSWTAERGREKEMAGVGREYEVREVDVRVREKDDSLCGLAGGAGSEG